MINIPQENKPKHRDPISGVLLPEGKLCFVCLQDLTKQISELRFIWTPIEHIQPKTEAAAEALIKHHAFPLDTDIYVLIVENQWLCIECYNKQMKAIEKLIKNEPTEEGEECQTPNSPTFSAPETTIIVEAQ